jgi:hypothetical protein
MQVTHDNHFVPQSYLRRWSKDGHRIWCYRILVPHENVCQWELRSVREVACRRDLYTSLVGGQESDEFEQWIGSEFETPAHDVIEKAVHGDTLTSSDWERLIRYLAAQDLRTPQNFIEFVAHWKDVLPEIMQNTLREAVRTLEEGERIGQKPKVASVSARQPFANVIKVKINPHARPETEEGEIGLAVTVGRRLWLESQRHLLENTAKVLLSHSWSIAEVANNREWFTSDHPVVRLNYYCEGSYDFKGGWGERGGNLFMPISRKHLLFTEIGEKLPNRIALSAKQTSEFRRYIAERADRVIFAYSQLDDVRRLRPRHVNLEVYRGERETWRNWHCSQSRAEQDLDGRGAPH